ncbi:MAG: hypothetical protein Q8P59_01335 [Dehalococcoidia bacterium]|nr:hypothetical protein [Dehalococcoidia bacterium]
MSGVDLVGHKLTPVEEQAMALYKGLKEFLSMPDLPPCALSNARVALAAVWQIVNDLDLEFEYIYGYGV